MTDAPNDRERKEREAAEAEAAGPDAFIAYLTAKTEALKELVKAAERERWSFRVKDYQLTVEEISLLGSEGAQSSFVDKVGMIAGHPEISVEDRRQIIEENNDLVTAIDQGMRLREYLEFESARSWLDREQSEDNNPDSNTGDTPE